MCLIPVDETRAVWNEGTKVERCSSSVGMWCMLKECGRETWKLEKAKDFWEEKVKE